MRIRRVVLAAVAGLSIAAIGFVVWSQEPVIAGIEPPAPASFDRALVDKGARLAAIGNCRVCHTAAGGPDYAGNRPIATPFGTIYSTNLTPAPGSGIGRWSEAAFDRAMRKGISRRGFHLYPAFPYDHYARLSEDDLHALYAFIMTRRPMETYRQANDLSFPLDRRWLLAFWNLLFLDSAPVRPDPHHDAEWNRGAYLVTALGHCGDCHTPRNLLGAEKSGALAGGESEGWLAPALNAASPAPVPWDAAHLLAYLRHGWDVAHGAAAGPMQPVAESLAQADEVDLRAIAAYLAAQQGEPSPPRRRRAIAALARASETALPRPAPGEELGATLFAGACAACHAGAGPAMVPPRGVNLALSTEVNAADPRNAIRIVLDGIRPADEEGPTMPRFAAAFTDAQLASLLGYVRAHYSDGPAWADLAAEVHRVRGGSQRP